MHKAIFTRLEQDPRQSLVRFASGKNEGISIVAGFGEGVDHPLWVGKISCTEAGMQRLRQERDALTYLQPWSQRFRIPSLLQWDESESEVCLIQGGVAGFPEIFDLGPGHKLPKSAERAMAWLDEFQATVPPAEDLTLSEMVDRLIQNLQSQPLHGLALGGVIDILKREQPANGPRRTITHGDFWQGNIFFGPDETSVIDWDELRTSIALEDTFTFVLSCVPCNGRNATAIEAIQYSFFSPSPAARFLRNRVHALGISEPEARFCFYFFVASRLMWKEFAEDWQLLFEWLRKQNYPTPTCFR